MSEQVDARGLSCPQPVILALDKIKSLKKGTFEVLVDTETSSENVTRAAESKGWSVKQISEQEEGYSITLFKD